MSSRRSAPRTSVRRAGAATRTRSTPAGCSRLLFFELGAIAVGAARGAIDRYEEVLRTKALDIPPFVLRGEVEEYQHHLGEAICLVDVAEAALLDGADRYMEQAARALEADVPVDDNSEETRRLLQLEQRCIRLAGEAIDLLFRTGGTSSGRPGHPIGTAMLAIAMMRTHMGLQWTGRRERRPPAARHAAGLRMTAVDELVAAADALRPRLLEEQAATEERTRYSEELHETFRELGFYRLLQPRRYGGLEMDVPTFYRVMMSIARGCPSTGWMRCLGSGHALQVGSCFAGGGAGGALRRRPLRRVRELRGAGRDGAAGARRLPRERHVALLLGRAVRDAPHRRSRRCRTTAACS